MSEYVRYPLLWFGMGVLWAVFAVLDMHKGYPHGAMFDFASSSVFLVISAVMFTLRKGCK